MPFVRAEKLDTVQLAHVNRQEAVIRRAVENIGEAGVFKSGEERFGFDLDDLVAASVGDAEFESGYVAVRRDDGAVAEEDFGGRAREPREEQARAKRQSEESVANLPSAVLNSLYCALYFHI